MNAASADLTQLASDLAYAAGEGSEKAALRLIQDTAQKVQQLAQTAAPRKTGRLSNSIQIRYVDTLSAVIGPTNVPYGVYQEFGTGTRGEFPGPMYDIKPKRPGGTLVFQVGGKKVFARVVHHPGVPPHPFMRPAALQALEPFTEELVSKGQLLITKGPRSAL